MLELSKSRQFSMVATDDGKSNCRSTISYDSEYLEIETQSITHDDYFASISFEIDQQFIIQLKALVLAMETEFSHKQGKN